MYNTKINFTILIILIIVAGFSSCNKQNDSILDSQTDDRISETDYKLPEIISTNILKNNEMLIFNSRESLLEVIKNTEKEFSSLLHNKTQ